MSVHVLSWVLRHSPVENHAQRLVLICLADKAGEDGGGAYPSLETIQREAKIKSRTTVKTALRELEQAGHIAYEGTSPLRTKSWRVEQGGQQMTPRPYDDPQGGQLLAPKPSLEPPFEQPSLEDGSSDGSGPILGPPPPTSEQQKAWQQARATLEQRASEAGWSMFLEDVELHHVAGHEYTLTTPASGHYRDYVEHRYSAMITGAIRQADPKATIQIRERQSAPQGSRAASPEERADTIAPREEEPCTTT